MLLKSQTTYKNSLKTTPLSTFGDWKALLPPSNFISTLPHYIADLFPYLKSPIDKISHFCVPRISHKDWGVKKKKSNSFPSLRKRRTWYKRRPPFLNLNLFDLFKARVLWKSPKMWHEEGIQLWILLLRLRTS